jgi:hypothetical protein
MTVQLVLLKSGEELIADVREIVDKETEKQVSLVFINPHRVSETFGDTLTFDPWLPLSASREFFVPYDWIVTITNPQQNIVDEFNNEFGEKNDSQSDSIENPSITDLGD